MAGAAAAAAAAAAAGAAGAAGAAAAAVFSQFSSKFRSRSNLRGAKASGRLMGTQPETI